MATVTCVNGELSGTVLGPYRLGGVLGQGGMSTVYRAEPDRRATSAAPLACKVMNEIASADPHLRARFRTKACVIDHPHVVPIHEVGEDLGRLFVVMRLVSGRTVHAELQRGPLLPARALIIFGQLCSALTALHRRGLMHLDVKPANVLLSDDHPTDHTYLVDYGLVGQGADLPSETFVGTPNYASPEHLRGLQTTPLSDVYSLTCVLFALLSGQPPFAGRLTEVITGHLRGRPPSLARVTGLPGRIDRVIAAGLDPDPDRRPAGPEQLADAAQAALAGC